MGVSRGECVYVLGTQNICLLRSMNQEGKATFGMPEHGTIERETKIVIQESGSAPISALMSGLN